MAEIINVKLQEIQNILNKIPFDRLMNEINKVVVNIPVDSQEQLNTFRATRNDFDEISKVGHFDFLVKQWVAEQMVSAAKQIFEVVKMLISEYSPSDLAKLNLGDFMYFVKN